MMSQLTISKTAYRLGITGAWVTIIGILFSGPLALIVVLLVQQPQQKCKTIKEDQEKQRQAHPSLFCTNSSRGTNHHESLWVVGC
jgi:hypothetical protein